jgi:hypothetical protein
MVPIEVRSITENTCLEGLDLVYIKLMTCGLKEGFKAV